MLGLRAPRHPTAVHRHDSKRTANFQFFNTSRPCNRYLLPLPGSAIQFGQAPANRATCSFLIEPVAGMLQTNYRLSKTRV